MNERIKTLRSALGLSQGEFGDRIGLKKATISLIENGKSEATIQTIKSICREFHVREQWLRTGEGEMYEPDKPESDVDLFLQANGIVDLEAELIKAYLELSPELRKVFINHFKEYFERKRALREAASGEASPEGSAEEAADHDDK